jgi:GT2 family glycosyltransferase
MAKRKSKSNGQYTTQKTMTDLSIIIVSYRGWVRLTKCLEALDSFTGKNFTFEVIVVDNRSAEDTIYKLEEQFPRFSFLHNEVNGGFANGCNLGSRSASGEFLLFLNPDTVAHESEVEKLLNVSKNNPAFGIVSCRQVNEKGKESISSGPFPMFWNITGFQRALFRSRKPEAGSREPEIIFPDWISGSVVSIRKEIFQKINGFDEDFWMYFEDVDLCRRVRNISLEVALCRNITIEHNHGGSSRINLITTSLTKTEVHISRHLYISKHKTGLDKFAIQTFLVINNLISGGLMALLGLLFFFVPKLFARTLIFFRLIRYYTGSVFRQSWISPRSVNFTNKN